MLKKYAKQKQNEKELDFALDHTFRQFLSNSLFHLFVSKIYKIKTIHIKKINIHYNKINNIINT